LSNKISILVSDASVKAQLCLPKSLRVIEGPDSQTELYLVLSAGDLNLLPEAARFIDLSGKSVNDPSVSVFSTFWDRPEQGALSKVSKGAIPTARVELLLKVLAPLKTLGIEKVHVQTTIRRFDLNVRGSDETAAFYTELEWTLVQQLRRAMRMRSLDVHFEELQTQTDAVHLRVSLDFGEDVSLGELEKLLLEASPELAILHGREVPEEAKTAKLTSFRLNCSTDRRVHFDLYQDRTAFMEELLQRLLPLLGVST